MRRKEKLGLPKFDQEKMNELFEVIHKVAEAIVDIFQKIMETLRSVFNSFWEALKGFIKQKNTKLYNLAYHHKKHRIRKKNKKRIWEMFMSEVNQNE